MPRLLVKGNSKLGRHIYSFSLPAVFTCPGSTPVCREECYALLGRYNGPIVLSYLQRSLVASRQATFVQQVVSELAGCRRPRIRWHASGDFYSVEYAEKCLSVFRACPHAVFFVYTRSWRVAEIYPALAAMARLPNVRLWFSCDRDSGVPVRPPARVRLAWMQADQTDTPNRAVDLVFRTGKLRRTVAKRQHGALVCPVENGTHAAVTCGSCRICVEPEGAAGGKWDARRFRLQMA